MKHAEKTYFRKISKELSNPPFDGKEMTNIPANLMASQYSYVYNFKTRKFEQLRGIEKVLGYKNHEFNLEMHYSKTHPDDRNIIFEASRIAIDYVNMYNLFNPEICQLTVLFRLAKSNNQYAHICRQTMLYQAYKGKLYKIFSLCNDVTELNLKSTCTVHFKAPGFSVNENVEVINKYKPCLNILSSREKDVVMLLSAGYNTKEISTKLNLSLNTIYTHRRNILKKTGKKNMVEIINEYV